MKKTYLSRNKKIIKLRDNHTYQQLGTMFNLSHERIRQIVLPQKTLYCKKHKRQYYVFCVLCKILKYYPGVLKKNHLNEEIRILSKKGRVKEAVYKKALLIKLLRDHKKMTYSQIGLLLGITHAAVINLYQKEL